MHKLFTEFENENANRTYPFASGCTAVDSDGTPIGTGLLIDAAIYPINATGSPYISSVSETGKVSISDDTGVIMEAVPIRSSGVLEFYETSGLRRHVGTILASSPEALDTFVYGGRKREFSRKATEFAASCVFPIENNGVLSLEFRGLEAQDGNIEFENTNNDDIRISTSAAGDELRFDVLPKPTSSVEESIQHIYCIVDGKTPFRIMKLPSGIANVPGNTIAVYLDNIDRSAVCGNAHREDSLVMVDTCECKPEPKEPISIPEFYQAEVVDIPNGADGAFYLASPNFIGYDNPLSVSLTDGELVGRKSTEVETDSQGRMSLKGGAVDTISGKGVFIQVPGLSAD